MSMPTPRQRDVFEAVVALTRANGYPPTMRELASRMGLAAATVHDHLAELERKGLIERSPDGRRLIRVTPDQGGL